MPLNRSKMNHLPEKDTDRAKVRETLLVIVLGFGLLYLWLDRPWMLYTALATGVAGMVSLRLNQWIHKGWFFLGDRMGRIMGKLLLGVIFFLVLVPVSQLSRLFRKDAFQLKKSANGTYHSREHLYRAEDLENMW
jgi:hypothetical protein